MSLIRFTQHTLERFVKNIKDRIQEVTPFTGTRSEWDALSSSEKAKYKLVYILGSGAYKRDATTGDLVPIAESGGSTSIGTGDSDGQIKVTPIVGTAYNVNVKGLKSAAYLDADTAATANKVVQRNASGYIYGTYINQSSSEESSATNARPCIIDGSGWHRKFSIAAFRNLIGLGNTTGALPVANGGTGATTAANARTNLEVKKLYAKTISNKSNFKTVVVEAVATIKNLSNESKYTAYIYIAGNGNNFGKYILDYCDGTNYRFTKPLCLYNTDGNPNIMINAIGCTSSGGGPWGASFYENAGGGIAVSDLGIATNITSATLYYYA